jgi:hypothetical protein
MTWVRSGRAGVSRMLLRRGFCCLGSIADQPPVPRPHDAVHGSALLQFWINMIALHTVLSLTPSFLAIAEWLKPRSIRCLALRAIRW